MRSARRKKPQACDEDGNGSLRSGWILASNARVLPVCSCAAMTGTFHGSFCEAPSSSSPPRDSFTAHHWGRCSNRLIYLCCFLQESGRSNFTSPAWGWTWDAMLHVWSPSLARANLFAAWKVFFSFNCLLGTRLPFWRSLVVADFLAASSRLPLACGTPRYL